MIIDTCQQESWDGDADGLIVRTMAIRYSSGSQVPSHAHDWGQLIFASEGVMNVITNDETWIVPPHRAFWVPAGLPHRIEHRSPVFLQTVYLFSGLCCCLPTTGCTVNVSPLLRELILHTVGLGLLHATEPAHRRLAAFLLDQMAVMPMVPLQIPLPHDARARRLADLLLADPGNRDSLDRLAKTAGASKRTLERLFVTQTGLTFVRWRQRSRLLHGLRLLAQGESVTNAALEVGYDSTSAFIAMFKQALGVTPSRYFES